MRRENFTSHRKLSAVILLLTFIFTAIAEEKDTNIVCFAAQKKWICAPEGQEQVANEKATKLIEKNSSELETSEVVIKPIVIPKFNSSTTQQVPQSVAKTSASTDQLVTKEKQVSVDDVEKSDVKNNVIKVNDDNPYAKLWSHQLVGVSTPQSAINFVKNKQLDKEEVLIIQSVRAGMDWWIVLYGLYKDKQTGLDNEWQLPKTIDKPWLRPLRNLKVLGYVEKF